MNKRPWFGRIRLERHYECKHCNHKTIKVSKAIFFFKIIITIPFTTKVSHMRMLEEGYY